MSGPFDGFHRPHLNTVLVQQRKYLLNMKTVQVLVGKAIQMLTNLSSARNQTVLVQNLSSVEKPLKKNS